MRRPGESRADKLALRMIYLDRLVAEAHRRGEWDYERELWEQRTQVQHERSQLMRGWQALREKDSIVIEDGALAGTWTQPLLPLD